MTSVAVRIDSDLRDRLNALKTHPRESYNEVIVPAFTFFATASAVSICGARPVFADVDPADAIAKISSKTKAVIGVHLYGQPCDAGTIRGICGDKEVLSSSKTPPGHTVRSTVGYGRGRSGDLACFSFYATKNLATGEGGMVRKLGRLKL